MTDPKKAILLIVLTLLFSNAFGQVTEVKKDTATNLKQVEIVSKIPPVEHKQGKTIINMDASATNSGFTVLEVLEKSPGITVDRNGGITMQGKAGVMVMIDDKPTYLTGSDLNNLLSSMGAAAVAQIELITNPTAKYDAAGNAGIINIKTKKTKQKGFNGTFNTSLGAGVYPKNSNGLTLNYRTGNINTFLNYNVNIIQHLTDLYARREYYNSAGGVIAQLDQPSYLKGRLINHILKTGLDYYVSPKTTVGFAVGGMIVNRTGDGTGTATWLNSSGQADSAIYTTNKTNSQLRNGTFNINAKHSISDKQDISADFDLLRYKTQSDQDYNNQLLTASGYNERGRGNIPTSLNIITGKLDYNLKLAKQMTFQSGWKSSFSKTDNIASYQNYLAGNWVDDANRNNHFLYNENIHALYSTIENKAGKISYQAGLRYEYTKYDARQFGNALQKDTAFTRKYAGFFPSGYVSYQADTANTFTLTIGRRIDRPAYQTLNPFLVIINKYTYMTGNAFILPQYAWNFELSHQYKSWLTTTISYSDIENYFSQIFVNGATPNTILYSQGNVGRTHNFGVSAMFVVPVVKWWSFTGQAVYNHKNLKGFNGNTYTTSIDQLNVNMNNQFSIGIYTAELSGFYTTRARNDVQELLYPTGQLSVGVARPIFNKKATLRFSARDLFYTNAMEGLTQFPNSSEYFILRRDTRVYTLALTYRFGKAYKTVKHSSGVTDEMQRAGNG